MEIKYTKEDLKKMYPMGIEVSNDSNGKAKYNVQL